MKTNGIEILLIGMTVSTLSLTLFIYLGNRILNFLKISDQPKLKQSERNFIASPLKSENLRKKIETKPNIICSLPIHQAGRQEAPLS